MRECSLKIIVASAIVVASLGGCGHTSAPAPSTPEGAAGPSQPGTNATSVEMSATGSSPSTETAVSKQETPAPRACADSQDSGQLQVGAAEVQRVVADNRPAINKACWEPAISKQPNGPAMVRLATEIEVAVDGVVRGVKVVGKNDYEAFNACVEKNVRTWCFPKAKQPATLMFPMVFDKAEDTKTPGTAAPATKPRRKK